MRHILLWQQNVLPFARRHSRGQYNGLYRFCQKLLRQTQQETFCRIFFQSFLRIQLFFLLLRHILPLFRLLPALL